MEDISDDLRFQAAYNGIVTLANAALRASGFRVSLRQGHHQRVIESLEYTLTTQNAAAREKWVRRIKSHSQKRNMTSYDLAGGISPTDLAQIRTRRFRSDDAGGAGLLNLAEEEGFEPPSESPR